MIPIKDIALKMIFIKKYVGNNFTIKMHWKYFYNNNWQEMISF